MRGTQQNYMNKGNEQNIHKEYFALELCFQCPFLLYSFHLLQVILKWFSLYILNTQEIFRFLFKLCFILDKSYCTN
jgi:hypothetical protein